MRIFWSALTVTMSLLRDLRDDAGAHRAPPLADREPQLRVHRHRLDQLDRHRHVVPRHHHLHPARQRAHPRHVRRPKIKLRPVPVEERRVPPPPGPAPHIHLPLQLLVGFDRDRLCPDPPPLPPLLFGSPPPAPHLFPPPSSPVSPTATTALPRPPRMAPPATWSFSTRSRTSSSARSGICGSSPMSALFMTTARLGTFTCRASSTCSRVCGIGPSFAATTR